MKKNLLLVLFIISMGHMLKAQQFFPPNLLWQDCYGGSNNDKGNAIKFTPDGGFIIVGSTLSSDSDVTSNAGNYDIWVVKLNSLGVIQWQHTYGGSSSVLGNDVLLTPAGGYLIDGTSSSNDGPFTTNKGVTDIVLVKIEYVHFFVIFFNRSIRIKSLIMRICQVNMSGAFKYIFL